MTDKSEREAPGKGGLKVQWDLLMLNLKLDAHPKEDEDDCPLKSTSAKSASRSKKRMTTSCKAGTVK
jgi:hypothetical protein